MPNLRKSIIKKKSSNYSKKSNSSKVNNKFSKKSCKMLKKKGNKSQKGGVRFGFDHNCRVGGLPARVAISECPNVGPLDARSIRAAYGQSNDLQVGGKRKLKSSKKSKKSRKSNKSGKSNKRK